MSRQFTLERKKKAYACEENTKESLRRFFGDPLGFPVPLLERTPGLRARRTEKRARRKPADSVCWSDQPGFRFEIEKAWSDEHSSQKILLHLIFLKDAGRVEKGDTVRLPIPEAIHVEHTHKPQPIWLEGEVLAGQWTMEGNELVIELNARSGKDLQDPLPLTLPVEAAAEDLPFSWKLNANEEPAVLTFVDESEEDTENEEKPSSSEDTDRPDSRADQSEDNAATDRPAQEDSGRPEASRQTEENSNCENDQTGRDLLKENQIQLKPEQIGSTVFLNLEYPSSYRWQDGDHFSLRLPDFASVWVANEFEPGAESGFETKTENGTMRVAFKDGGNLPSCIAFQLQSDDPEREHALWVLYQSESQTISLDVEFVNREEIPSFTDSDILLESYAPSMSDFVRRIDKDSYSRYEWNEIAKAFGTSGQQKVFNKVKEIVNKGSLTSLDKRPLIDISDKVQKLKVINRYLIQTIDYENNYKKLKDGGQTAYSALIGRKTVCSGYAHAFSLLANASGVETYIVGGTGNATGKFEPHSWNISKLGNYYYSIDVTWNDSFNAETRWFLLGKTNINKDHRPDPANFKTPGTKLAKEGTWLAASNFVHVSGVSASYKSKTVPNNGRLTLELGGTYSISLSTSSGSRYSLTWYSGDTNIFTVNSSKGAGAVIKATPVKAGSAELKIYSPNRREYTIQVQVPDKKFTIKYEANGGKGATMKDTVVHYGQKVTTTKCTYTRDGYSFGGWYVYSDRKKQYMYKSSSGNRFMSDAEAARHKYPKSIYSNGTPLAKTTDIDGDVLRFKAVWNALPSLSSASVTLSSTSYTYTGSAIQLGVTVKLGNKTLSSGKDYTVSCSSNISAGTATVTITGKGNYTGSAKKTFTIKPASLKTDMISAIPDQTWTGQPIAPSVTVSHGKTRLIQDKDYTLSYSGNREPGTASLSITGKGNYTGSAVRKFEIVPVRLSEDMVGQIAEQIWTGREIQPSLTVRSRGADLIPGQDYTVSYANNVNVGTASLTIQGTNHYTGSVTRTFSIRKEAAVPRVAMFRLYNPNSGEHFYTAQEREKNSLIQAGWTYENIGWYAPQTSRTPVYRLYNRNAGDHHYTMSVNERDHLIRAGWTDEGIGWYSDDAQGVPLYRQYNPNAKSGSHNYTTDPNENAFLVRNGWNAEGIGWYGLR